MSDSDDELNEDLEDDLQRIDDPNVRKTLRQAKRTAKERDEFAARATAAERQLALYRAGVPGEGLGEMFAKAYDGPIDDIDAIREQARKWGVLPKEEGEQQSQVAAELAAQQRVAQASAGTPPPGAVPLEDALNNAQSVEELMRIVANAPPEAGIRPAGIR